MKKMILTGLTTIALSANVFAGEVAGYTAPESGQTATAAGVDANFQALITAINDNSQRLDALEGIVGDGGIDGTYTFIEMAVELSADSRTAQASHGYSEISSYSSTGTLTLESGGSFSGTISENRSTLKDDINGDCGSEEGCRNAFDPDFDNTGSEIISGTWSDDGSVVTLAFGPSDTLTLHKAGLNLLVANDKETVTSEGEPVYDYSTIFMLVKQ